jgi:ribonuclease BN (tRNA processing enzyme)
VLTIATGNGKLLAKQKEGNKMQITMIGTGSAFTMKGFQTNAILTRNGKNMLIDAGSDTRFSLAKSSLSYKDIDALYVTHLHADHIGGIEYLAFCSFFDPSVKDNIHLIANNELLRNLWNHSLQGGLKSIQGRQMGLMDFFDIMSVRKNESFEWEGIGFRIVQTVHIMDGYAIVPSYGLLIDDPDSGKKIFYTGDTQFNPNQIRDFYAMSDLIIQDCETAPFQSKVHAHYDELKTLPADIKRKMRLVHFQDNVRDDFVEWNKKALADGFFNLIGSGGVSLQPFISDGEEMDTICLKNPIIV